MERLQTPFKASTKAYLTAQVAPALTDALTRLGIVRPDDPYFFLAEYLLNLSPNRDQYVLAPRAAGSAFKAAKQLATGGEATPRAAAAAAPTVGDGARASLGGANASLGGAHSSLGGAHASLGGAHASLGGAHASLGGAHASLATPASGVTAAGVSARSQPAQVNRSASATQTDNRSASATQTEVASTASMQTETASTPAASVRRAEPNSSHSSRATGGASQEEHSTRNVAGIPEAAFAAEEAAYKAMVAAEDKAQAMAEVDAELENAAAARETNDAEEAAFEELEEQRAMATAYPSVPVSPNDSASASAAPSAAPSARTSVRQSAASSNSSSSSSSSSSSNSDSDSKKKSGGGGSAAGSRAATPSSAHVAESLGGSKSATPVASRTSTPASGKSAGAAASRAATPGSVASASLACHLAPVTDTVDDLEQAQARRVNVGLRIGGTAVVGHAVIEESSGTFALSAVDVKVSRRLAVPRACSCAHADSVSASPCLFVISPSHSQTQAKYDFVAHGVDYEALREQESGVASDAAVVEVRGHSHKLLRATLPSSLE
jgi:hypothetical protein